MIQEVVTFDSGSKLSMQVAPWKVVGNLRRVLARELKVVGLDLSSGFVGQFLSAALTVKEGDPESKVAAKLAIMQALGGTDLDVLKNLALQLVGSEDLENAVFDCLFCCTYNGVKISPDIFEPEDARADYYPIVWEVLKLNLRPFFKSLISTSASPTPQKAGSPTS